MQDGFSNCPSFFQGIAVPETNDLETLVFEMGIALFVIFVVRVLRSVGLDDHAIFEVHKISDVPVNNDLPFEFVIAQPLGAQDGPKPLFRISRIGPHIFGSVEE